MLRGRVSAAASSCSALTMLFYEFNRIVDQLQSPKNNEHVYKGTVHQVQV